MENDDEKVTPRYNPGNVVNIEVEIVEARTGIDSKTNKIVVVYQVQPTNESVYLNTMIIRETAIQD